MRYGAIYYAPLIGGLYHCVPAMHVDLDGSNEVEQVDFKHSIFEYQRQLKGSSMVVKFTSYDLEMFGDDKEIQDVIDTLEANGSVVLGEVDGRVYPEWFKKIREQNRSVVINEEDWMMMKVHSIVYKPDEVPIKQPKLPRYQATLWLSCGNGKEVFDFVSSSGVIWHVLNKVKMKLEGD